MSHLEKITSLAKRRGFIYQSSEIYGGLAGFWDYGPLGVALKNNIKNLWWKKFVDSREDMYGLDASIIMNPKVWEASGHLSGFSDPLVTCKKCKGSFRTDQLENWGNSSEVSCPNCGAKGAWTEVQQFNMMFKTNIGALEDSSSKAYLRPETAQGIFVNFKNIVDSFHPKLPFGIAQIGKAFRNEIAPRDFVFRSREFEQMEIEYFIKSEDWKEKFEYWREEIQKFLSEIGLDSENIHELEVPEGDRAHYSERTIDFEFDFPFGKRELCGLAYRTDFDLKNHGLKFLDDDPPVGEKKNFIPHCIEPTFGLDRLILAILSQAYTEDDLGGETRSFLKLKPELAPVRIAVFPLLKNKPQLVEKARGIYKDLREKTSAKIIFDDNGNIGKRYRRQDEIGTPYCVTIDFDTLEDDTVTVRDRDTGKQERVKIKDLSTQLFT